MYKKIISLLSVLALIFSLAACTDNKEPGGTDGNNINTEENSDNSVPYSSDSTDSTDGTENTSNTDAPTSEKTEPSTQPPVEKVKITVPEGYTLAKIGMLLEEKGLCTAKEFIAAAQSYKSWLDTAKYPFLSSMQNSSNVCFYLEGYLFPATYSIPKNSSAKDIIRIMLNGTASYYNSNLLSRVQQSGYSLHQILTIASIIEKEVKTNEQRPMVSSVIHNRIKANMKLECDPTTYYCEYVIKPFMPDKFDHYVNYYSSKRVKGLISGPICNPGMASINAALAPASTDYLFFIIEKNPPHTAYYSKTYEEHSSKWEEVKDK